MHWLYRSLAAVQQVAFQLHALAAGACTPAVVSELPTNHCLRVITAASHASQECVLLTRQITPAVVAHCWNTTVAPMASDAPLGRKELHL
jgi:hypothetical protein